MAFYKETNLQETQIGKIPRDWKSVSINQLSEVRRGASPRPIGDPKYFSDKGRGWVRISDVTETYKYLRKTSQYLSEFGESKSVKVDLGDLIMSICATIGRPILVDMEACIHDGFVVFRNLSREVDTEFLFYVLQKYESKFAGMRQTGTQGNLNTKLVGSTPIPLPPLSEQRAIVGVLSVVDLAVAKVGEVIAKTERLKKGLMQQLLTRGIGHTEYKQTPIGTIPETWQTVKLEDVAEIRGNKSVSNFEKIAFIPMELIPETRIFAKYQIRAKEDVRSSTYCEAGDLLLAKITPSLENGKQGIVPSDVPNKVALATTEVFPIHCKGIDKFFLFYTLKFSKFRNKIISSMIGTTGRQRASKESVERLEIPLPPIDEQQKIAEILSNVDEKLELERNEKSKLERIKQGLMDLLLTGKIRVKVD